MRASPTPGTPEPDPDTADVVRDIVRRVMRGDALTRIARDLNHIGTRPRRGKTSTHTGIDRLLASPAIGGLVEVEGELRPAAFPGLVPAPQWRAARAALARRPRGEARRPRESLTLLGGLLRCAEHGQLCYGGGSSHSRIYAGGAPGSCYIRIPRQPADDYTGEVVVDRLTRPGARDLLAPRHDPSRLEADAEALRHRREEIAASLPTAFCPPPSPAPSSKTSLNG